MVELGLGNGRVADVLVTKDEIDMEVAAVPLGEGENAELIDTPGVGAPVPEDVVPSVEETGEVELVKAEGAELDEGLPEIDISVGTVVGSSVPFEDAVGNGVGAVGPPVGPLEVAFEREYGGELEAPEGRELGINPEFEMTGKDELLAEA